MTKLSPTEKNYNIMVTENLFSLIDDLRADYAVGPLQDLILKFAETNNITFMNLLDKEEMALADIMRAASKQALAIPANQAAVENDLTAWMGKLYHAKYGKGSHVEAHLAQVSGMAQSLLKSGSVPETQWGTDLDILQCLHGSISYPDQLKSDQDSYIFSPISLTESPEAIKDKLAETLNVLKKKDIQSSINISIPVNCGNNHWRLVNVKFNKQALESVELWDSLGGSNDALKNTIAYRNLQNAVNAVSEKALVVTPTKSGIQKNGYSCMDYCVRSALINLGEIDGITAAIGPRELRLSILQAIATHHPLLGDDVAKNLAHEGNVFRNTKFAAVAAPAGGDDVLSDEDAAVFEKLKIEGVSGAVDQVAFDRMLASKLSGAYKDIEADEKVLFEKALKQAARDFGLFKQKPVAASGAADPKVDPLLVKKPTL